MSIKRIDNWSLGMNNNAQPDKLPDGHVRQLVNLDATASGALVKRPGYDRIVERSDVRMVGRAGNYLIIVADDLLVYDKRNDTLATIQHGLEAGPVTGVTHLERFYFTAGSSMLRTDGVTVSPWVVPEPLANVSLSAGGVTGTVKVALTAFSDDGEESSFDPLIFSLNDQSITVSSSDERRLSLYVSPPNHETLYHQTEVVNGSATIGSIDDSGHRFDLGGLVPFPKCEILASSKGTLIGATGNWLFVSTPMMPHLHNPVSGFFQYETDVTEICPVDGGIFVGTAGATYFISLIETEPSQRLVSRTGIIKGTKVDLNDGACAWFTTHGQAVGSADGSVLMLNEDKFSPSTAADGAASLIELNGNKVVVTTMRGSVDGNGLGIGFYSELEV